MSKDKPVWALGAMSGTSLDGVDAALLRTDGLAISEFGETAYRPYTDAERAVLRAALGREPGEAGVAEAAEIVEAAHAELLAKFPDAELIGFHGQTLAHVPEAGRTHQAGDGSVLAEVLGVPVVWDFRAMDMQMGGQGAPLAPFFHHACARFIGADAPLAILNVGGVANITWIDPRLKRAEAPDALAAFDIGPGNAPLNDAMQARLGLAMDEGGALAREGTVDIDVIAALLSQRYFNRMPPKSLDRDAFSDLGEKTAHLSDSDAAATLTAAVAAAVSSGVGLCPRDPAQVLVTGGGRKNPVMMEMLAAGLDCPVVPIEDVGLDGDMLEAQAFAYLAVRVLRGLPTSAPGTTGVAAPVGGGQISRPPPG